MNMNAPPNKPKSLNKHVGRGMAFMLIGTGVTHFLFPKPFDTIVPPFLPGDPRIWTYLSGVAELFIAALLLISLDKSFAGKLIRLWGVYAAFALFVAVFPANIYMAIEWSTRDFPAPLFAYLRLPLQLGLFYWTWALVKEIKKFEKVALP
ncbi:MAG: hypothetical protein RLZZ07_356 [Actinomycetota bacterium]